MNFSQGKYPGNITIQKKTRMPNFLSGQAPTKTEDNLEGIIQLFSSNYKNILPNKFDVNFDFNSMVFVFSKEQIIELLYQMDTLVQLVIQNLLFCTNDDTKFKTYELLLKIVNRKEYVMNYLNVPAYKVYLSQFKSDLQLGADQNSSHNKQSLCFEAKPQMTILQSPLLEFANVFVEIRRKCWSRERLLQVLEEFAPLVNKRWLPEFLEGAFMQNTSRTKFSSIDDNLLLIGLTKYGYRSFDVIQENFLTDKTVSEVKNRYKNLTCTRAAPNNLKFWKNSQESTLTKEELNLLQKGIEWFGTSKARLNLIAKYFLPERKIELIQNEIKNITESVQQMRSDIHMPMRASLPTITINPPSGQNNDPQLGFLDMVIENNRSSLLDHDIENEDENTSEPEGLNFEQVEYEGTEDSGWGLCEQIDLEHEMRGNNKVDCDHNFVVRSQMVFEHVTLPGDDEPQQYDEEGMDMEIEEDSNKQFKTIGNNIFEVADFE